MCVCVFFILFYGNVFVIGINKTIVYSAGGKKEEEEEVVDPEGEMKGRRTSYLPQKSVG